MLPKLRLHITQLAVSSSPADSLTRGAYLLGVLVVDDFALPFLFFLVWSDMLSCYQYYQRINMF